MSRKRHTAEEIFAKLRQVDVLTAQGRTVAEAIRQIGVTEVTYYRWRSEYGELKSDQIKRLKELEAENARLRRGLRSEANLLDERKTSELREQFIAVLGHDLRKPLASIDAGARMLLREPLTAKGAALVGLIQGSVGRMAELIDNVLDLLPMVAWEAA